MERGSSLYFQAWEESRGWDVQRGLVGWKLATLRSKYVWTLDLARCRTVKKVQQLCKTLIPGQQTCAPSSPKGWIHYTIYCAGRFGAFCQQNLLPKLGLSEGCHSQGGGCFIWWLSRSYLYIRAYQKMKKFSDFKTYPPKDEVWLVEHCAKILEKSGKSLRRTKPLETYRSKIRRKSPFSPSFLPVMIAMAMISTWMYVQCLFCNSWGTEDHLG